MVQKEGVFWRSPKKLGIGNGIGNLLEHLSLPKEHIFSIGKMNDKIVENVLNI